MGAEQAWPDLAQGSDTSRHRSENVAFDAFSCATVPVLSESGPANLLKNKNHSNHRWDYEPGGREFESLRARQLFQLVRILAIEPF